MMKKVFCQGYLWLLLLLLYSPIFIIIIFSFTEAKVMGNWTGFSLQLYKNLFAEGTHHSLTAALVNTVTIALITATVSTLFGTLTAIGIYNLRNRYARNAIQFVNNIPILNGDIIIGISLFSKFCLAFTGERIHSNLFQRNVFSHLLWNKGISQQSSNGYCQQGYHFPGFFHFISLMSFGYYFFLYIRWHYS
jgi:ABC-type spermidine/putrescine transport system permease subunit II